MKESRFLADEWSSHYLTSTHSLIQYKVHPFHSHIFNSYKSHRYGRDFKHWFSNVANVPHNCLQELTKMIYAYTQWGWHEWMI